MKYINMSWEEFDKAVDVLVVQIKKERYPPKAIYGVPRGGLVLAVCLSHRLNIPLVTEPIEGALLVDDVAETGKTLERIYFDDRDFMFHGIAVLYQCNDSKFLVGHFAKRKSSDEWIVFPWEKKCSEVQSRVVNYVKGKKITDMKAGDTLYIQRPTVYREDYLCEFISYERGNVKVKVIGIDYKWLKGDLGKIITTKPSKCFLWGQRTDDSVFKNDNCCHWFRNGVVE